MIITFPINCPWCNKVIISDLEHSINTGCYCNQDPIITNLSFNISLFHNAQDGDYGATFSSFFNYGENCFLACTYIFIKPSRGIFNISSCRYGIDRPIKIAEFMQSTSEPNINHSIEESVHLLRKYKNLMIFI